jgi:hypothetical protein
MTMTINGSSGLIFPDGSGQESGIGRNRIINGDMVISQRNGTSSVTPAAAVATYTLDRFYCYPTQASKLTIQQNQTNIKNLNIKLQTLNKKIKITLPRYMRDSKNTFSDCITVESENL